MEHKQTTLDSWLTRGRPKRPEATATTTSRREAREPEPRNSRFQAPRDNPAQREELARVAHETREVLPGLLAQLPGIQAKRGEVVHLRGLSSLRISDCPRTGGACIKIVNMDTLDAAMRLRREFPGPRSRVAVLNMASNTHPGGGWRTGAMAQEESICYRSSLYMSLHRRHYPWSQRMGIYTGDVVVIRSSMRSGHKLLVPDCAVDDLPIVSVLSIAALRCPATRSVTPPVSKIGDDSSAQHQQRTVYANYKDRDLTVDKMRLCLRMAASHGHTQLVLGALGCGAFRNPPREIAECWLEVLTELEFQGGWWDQVWFAVYDAKNEGNFELFEEVLGNVQV
ncbi:Uncharacterized protein GMORB2_7345 [Geosmithia morbida]|uniref:Microbial-type PARG catalytic domain-containing protein n=1 Tax=Geosmithia morbida TaxID=1094350 RepID=A0A9P4YVB2_9HYPO|nr:Uncharacterized protein GMORB2_7345 [Geosmithia morbida]KAF4122353.1 Uncharacterized protein GMORB2_7345 [Geosmithia morbida]